MEPFGMVTGLFIVVFGGVALLQATGLGTEKTHLLVLVKYYTSVSNIIVVSYTLYSMITGVHHSHQGQVVGFSVMMCIVLTFLIYHVLLSPYDRAQMKEKKERRIYFNFGNMVLHYVVPILAVVRYLIVEEKNRLDWWDGIFWTIIPIIYLAAIFSVAGFSKKRGKEAFYPYVFMDANTLGLRKALMNVAAIMIIFILLGLGASTLMIIIF